jgi:Tfp pilus assembly protein PilZ
MSKPDSQGKPDLSPAVSRKFGRNFVSCPAVLVFSKRQAHPRIKAHLFQIGSGGCALSSPERLFIGEECLVWANVGGKKHLGVAGKVVWLKTVYEGHQTELIGIEFKEPMRLGTELLAALGAKSKK